MKASPTLTRRISLASTLLASSLAAASCGGEEVAPPGEGQHTGVLANLLIDAEEVADVARDGVVVARFTMTASNRDECPWEVEGPGKVLSSMLQPMGGTEDRSEMIPGISARGLGPKSFSFPAEFGAGDVTRVLAFASCYGAGIERVRAVAYDASGEGREASDWQPVAARRDPHSLEFELAAPADRGAARAGVRIEFEGKVEHGALMSIALQDQPVAGRMPRVGAPGVSQRGESWRSCAGLVEDGAWECEVSFPGTPGTRTVAELSLTLPTWSGGTAEGTRMFLSVLRDGEETVARSIEIGDLDSERWTDVSVDLGSVTPGRGTVRLMIEDDDAARTAHVLVGDAVVVEPTTQARTVLLITSDTHRADHLGIADARPFVDTPSLNALGRRGVYFTSAFSTSNVTNPSHIAVMTGIHPRDTQIVDNETRLTGQVQTLAEVFRANGYRTFAAISTQHLDPSQSGLGQGFDRFDSPAEFKRSGNVAVDHVREWISDAEGQSVFAWVHVFDAHAPYDPPSARLARYVEDVPKTRDGGFSMSERFVPSWVRAQGIGNEDYVDAMYAAEVDFVDRALSDLLDMERMRSALIGFTADHGESLRTHSIYWDHAGMYLPNLAVPMILAGPGLDAVETDVPVHQSNIARTLIDLAQIDAEFPGQNLMEIAVDNRRVEPLYGLSSHGLQATVTLEDWHLVLDLRTFEPDDRAHQWLKGRTRLYDRRSGVDSEEDVSEANPDVTAELRGALIKWLGDASSEALGSASQVSEQGAENLRVLGYTGFAERTSSSWYSLDPDEDGR